MKEIISKLKHERHQKQLFVERVESEILQLEKVKQEIQNLDITIETIQTTCIHNYATVYLNSAFLKVEECITCGHSRN